MRPIRAFYNGLVGGLAVGVLLGILITEYYFADAWNQYGYNPIGILNSLFLIWLVIVGIVLAAAYETHKAASSQPA
jgi:high-affinity Fe2+/Pb2+ permease